MSRLRPSRRGGFTYPELLLAATGLAVAGSLLVALAGDVRGRSATDATARLLDATRAQLALYEQVYARLPDLPPAGDGGITSDVDAHNAALVATLRRLAGRGEGPTLPATRDGPLPAAMDTGDRLLDAWGTPVVMSRSDLGGDGTLVSAGADRRFRTRGDNVYSDQHPPPRPPPRPPSHAAPRRRAARLRWTARTMPPAGATEELPCRTTPRPPRHPPCARSPQHTDTIAAAGSR